MKKWLYIVRLRTGKIVTGKVKGDSAEAVRALLLRRFDVREVLDVEGIPEMATVV